VKGLYALFEVIPSEEEGETLRHPLAEIFSENFNGAQNLGKVASDLKGGGALCSVRVGRSHERLPLDEVAQSGAKFVVGPITVLPKQ
jgi:hypothetical protein